MERARKEGGSGERAAASDASLMPQQPASWKRGAAVDEDGAKEAVESATTPHQQKPLMGTAHKRRKAGVRGAEGGELRKPGIGHGGGESRNWAGREGGGWIELRDWVR